VKQVLTVSCKIEASAEQSAKFQQLCERFAEACNWINQSTPKDLTNQIAMQSLVYHDVRNAFSLSANLAIQAVRRVCANRKTAKQKGRDVKEFAPTSVSYDARTFSFREKDWTVSFTTLAKRERCKLLIGNYQLGKLKGQKPTSATLLKRSDGSWYAQIQIKSEPPKPQKSSNVIGVDFGRRDIAVTSNGDSYSGDEINQVRDKYSRLRANIQQKASKGTRSSRRRCRQLLQRLSGKEKRFQSQLNHTISYRIIKQAVDTQSIVAIEDLTGIRERTNKQPRRKAERRRSNSWAFYQLRQYLEYKGLASGVRVLAVSPVYTSQTCHNCLHIHPVKGKSYRSGKKFSCSDCGWTGDADLNGAKNIQKLGHFLAVPGGPMIACSLNRDDSGLLKSPSSKRLSA